MKIDEPIHLCSVNLLDSVLAKLLQSYVKYCTCEVFSEGMMIP